MQKTRLVMGAVAVVALGYGVTRIRPPAQPVGIEPQAMPDIGSVSDRFLSYNVEMVEVTGGRFWRPYDSQGETAGEGDDRYEYRPPIDLGNARLRKLAAALGPSYVRVSGTWANATYFADTDEPLEKAPDGFDTVLTRDQWRGVVEFAQAAGAGIVTSMAVSPGTRDAQGLWQPDHAERLLRYSQSIGGAIAAAEFANEPNLIEMTQPPEGYTATDYRRDYARFHGWMRKASPDTLVLAPGAAELGEPIQTLVRLIPGFATFDPDELLTSDSPKPDAFSFHFYGSVSKRCGIPAWGSPDAAAMKPGWLARIDDGIRRSAERRDRVAPGAPLWNTETAEAACGGNPWAKTFVDSFRFVDQLARSARQDVQVFMHNTLAASDYALLDEHAFAPRPNYWAAWLWRNLMGTTVLGAGAGTTDLDVYAHCQRNVPGGVTVIAINLDREDTRLLQVQRGGQLHALTQGDEGPGSAALNGLTLKLGADDALPTLAGKAVAAGDLILAPASINFLTFPGADNPACR